MLRIMREHGLLTQQRSVAVRGPQVRDRTFFTDQPDRTWAIDATGCLADEGNATVSILGDHCTASAWACEPRCGVRDSTPSSARARLSGPPGGHYQVGIATGVSLRHDHGSQFIYRAFRGELETLGIESSPSFVRHLEGNGRVERFIRTLKEQLLWLRRFGTVAGLDAALR